MKRQAAYEMAVASRNETLQSPKVGHIRMSARPSAARTLSSFLARAFVLGERWARAAIVRLQEFSGWWISLRADVDLD